MKVKRTGPKQSDPMFHVQALIENEALRKALIQIQLKLVKIENFIDSEKFDDLCAEFGSYDFTKPLEKLKGKLKETLKNG